MTRVRAVRDGAPVEVEAGEAGLSIDGALLDWLDIDGFREGDHRVTLELADASTVTLSALGVAHDRFVTAARALRRRSRFAALTVATGEPLHSYVSRASTGLADVHVYARVLVVEPRDAPPVAVPLSLIETVERRGYSIRVAARGLPTVEVTALGATTDEFVDRLARARAVLAAATGSAYAGLHPALAGFAAPDGWAVTEDEAGSRWPALCELARSGARRECVDMLAAMAGHRLAVGVYTDGGGDPLLFVLAAVGDRVVLEATDADDRATFVFATDDVARLNAVLVLTGFRREAVFLPDDQLGRWAVAARTWPAVREARRSLVSRVVHDERWRERVEAALST